MKNTGIFIVSVFFALGLSLNFSSAVSAVPSIQKGEMNDISYATGGVGQGERQALENMADDYNLKVVLAGQSGSFLSGLMVVIEDESGNMVFETVSHGPWLYVDLPAGTYKVTVSYKNRPKMREVHVDKGLRTVLFHWKI